MKQYIRRLAIFMTLSSILFLSACGSSGSSSSGSRGNVYEGYGYGGCCYNNHNYNDRYYKNRPARPINRPNRPNGGEGRVHLRPAQPRAQMGRPARAGRGRR